MNKQQIEYAFCRVETLLNLKRKQLETKFTKQALSVSEEDRVVLIKSGKVKLRSEITRIKSYDDVIAVFDFSKYEHVKEFDEASFNAAFEKYNTQATKIKDNLMLGNSDEALKAIEKFALMCEK